MGGFILTVIIAVFVAYMTDFFSKNLMQGGRWGAWLPAQLGAWIGCYSPFFDGFGPEILGISIVPTILGSIILTVIMGLFIKAVMQESR